ncbi:MAG: ATP-binding protein [Pseudomonadota bacterium]
MNLNKQNLLGSAKLSWSIDLLRELKLSHRIALLIGVFCVGIISFGLWSFKTLDEIKVGGPIYERIEQSQSLIADVLPPPMYVIESYLVCLQITSAAPGEAQENLITRLLQLRTEFESRSDFWARQKLGSGLSEALLVQAKNPATAFYDAVYHEFLPALRSNNQPGVDLALNKLGQLYNEHRLAINRVVELARHGNLAEEQSARAQIKYATALQGILLMFILLFAGCLAVFIWLSIVNPLGEALAVAKTIASGDLIVWQGKRHPDEVGQLLFALAEMGASLRNIRFALLEGRRSAEAANRAKSIFLANMSHELRTPLNAILGFAKLLERDSEMTEESRKKIATINRSGEHLLALINNVLEISRIEADRIVIGHQPFDLIDLLTSIEEMIKGRAEEKGLTFLNERAGDLPLYVEGDAQHLKQVLLNLLSNAVKYTERGHVSLKVSRANGEIQFEIADTGRGISAEEQRHLFEVFYQTEAAIAQGEGTGLGLAISLHYTRLMGGHLELQSTPDHGSVFTLRLTLPETQTKAVQIAGNQTILGLEEGQEGLRILVVDDKEDNRELLRLLLETTGFEVRTADDGTQAVLAFQSWQPCFIWMDVRMPGIDGYEATRQIRVLPGGDKVKIVALTASVFEQDRAATKAAGCDGMVSKPIDEERLFSLMAELLGVRYRYAGAGSAKVVLSTAELELSVLSPEMLQMLIVAANALDVEMMQWLLEQIRATHPDIAIALESLMQEFRFDRIAELCRSVPAQS